MEALKNDGVLYRFNAPVVVLLVYFVLLLAVLVERIPRARAVGGLLRAPRLVVPLVQLYKGFIFWGQLSRPVAEELGEPDIHQRVRSRAHRTRSREDRHSGKHGPGWAQR